MLPPVPLVLLGAGNRGAEAYATYSLRRPEELRITAVAEPDDAQRLQFGKKHSIPMKRWFRSWEELLDAPMMGDAALICTPDEFHAQSAVDAMLVGYHVLLEPPIASEPQVCLQLLDAARKYQKMLIISHPLRYTAFYRALSEIVRSGRLGQITNYQQHYDIASWHTAHRFMRGHATDALQTSLMHQLGVHELDLMCWLLNDSVTNISSVGSLRQFTLNDAPVGNVPERCVDNCPVEMECPFSAVGIYLERRFREMPVRGYPYNALAYGDEKPDALVRAIESTRWGRCVYHLGSHVVDHQSVLLQTQTGISVSMTMSGHSLSEERMIKIDGSHAALTAHFAGLESHITISEHGSKKQHTMNFRLGPTGHGGDHGIMGGLTKILRGEAEPLTPIERVVDAHLLAFAAEEARITQQTINFPAYKEALRVPEQN